jgi:hypothetical protein
MTTALVVIVAVAACLVVAHGMGAVAWRRWVDQLLVLLNEAGQSSPALTARFFTEQVAELPAPVQRYFAFALSPGQPVVLAAHTTSRGEFRMSPAGKWHTFTATQDYTVSPHAFVWDAAIDVAPLIEVDVTDRYLDGEGGIHARIASVIPVVNEHATPELASGELLRYLAEAVVMPTALLPSSGVCWTAVDDNSARATLSDHDTTVSAIFHFGPRGEVVRVSAQRYRDASGTTVLTPWVGQFRDYKSVQGMMVPMVGEVAWILSGDVASYYRGRTTTITFELAA